jgi:hypothetical protein
MSQRLKSYLLKGTIVPVCCCSIYLRHLFATVALFVSTGEGEGFLTVHFLSTTFSDFLIGHPAEPSYAG